MTSLALFPEPRPSAVTAIDWLQRGLLVALAIGHLVLPALFLFGQGELVRDAILQAQLSLFILALVWGGWNWRTIGVILLGGAILFVVWHVVIPEHLWSYAWQSTVLPSLLLLVVVHGLRCASFRGNWSGTDQLTTPFQVSLGQLLAVTTLAAVAFAGATWVRQLPADWIGTANDNYFLQSLLDGVGVTGLSLVAVWAIGVRGGTGIKLLVLVAAAIVFGGCQIYAFHLDSLWPYLALTSAAWIGLVAGTLGVWRVCGWHLILGRGTIELETNGGGGWLRPKFLRWN